MDIALSHSPFFGADVRRRAAIALGFGLVAGLVTQALFWRTGIGLNFWIWDVGAVAASVLVFQRGRLRATAAGAMALAILLGFFVVRYQGPWTLFIALPAALTLLAALPFLLAHPSSLADLAGVPARVLASLTRTPKAVVDTARLPGVALDGAPPGLVRGVARGLLMGVPTAALFAVLLASDTDFARSLFRIEGRLREGLLFVAASAVTAVGYLVLHAVHAARRDDARASRDDLPYRALVQAGASRVARAPLSVSVVTWAMVVSQVAIVFALFVAANVRHLFGGHALVRAPGSLTYARYLHAGFYEVLAATILSVCLVRVGHVLLQRHADASGGRVPGGWLLTGLEGTLLVLTGITVASCWQRLGIYEDAYGASHLRLGVAFIEALVLGVVLLTLGKVAARGWSGHAGAVVAFAAAMSVVASGFNADAYVARTNLDRAAAGKPLDVDYLGSLSGDARALLDHPYVTAHPELAARLDASFCAPHASSWRSFRGIGACRR